MRLTKKKGVYKLWKKFGLGILWALLGRLGRKATLEALKI